MVKKQADEENAVVATDNSDITKPCHPKYDIPKFIFYALRYATRRVLAGTRPGIIWFLMKKKQSQRLTLAQCFSYGDFRVIQLSKMRKLRF